MLLLIKSYIFSAFIISPFLLFAFIVSHGISEKGEEIVMKLFFLYLLLAIAFCIDLFIYDFATSLLIKYPFLYAVFGIFALLIIVGLKVKRRKEEAQCCKDLKDSKPKFRSSVNP